MTPPVPALYDVRIGHTRARPRRSFEHRATLWLVDLDDVAAGRLTTRGRLPRWLAAQARFEAADHVGDPGRSIKENVVAFAAEHGVPDVDRVLMLANPRSGAGRASYVFNPLSTHWCYRADGALACVVAEVHNTYGERHAYLLRPDGHGRAEVDKSFYVSPFLTVDGRYRMRVPEPGASVHVGVTLHQDGELAFSAWLRGKGRPATVAAVALATLRRPLMALRVSALIRVHGITLWARRLPLTPRTGAPVPHRSPAARLAALATEVLGDLPVRIRAWDGSEAGPDDAPTVVIRDRRALRRLLWDPSELGLARAWVAGELDVDGDLAEGLSRVWAQVRRRPPSLPGLRDRLRWAAGALRLGVVGPRPAPPAAEAVLSGEKHSTDRDSDAISYHYDQSNELYATLLDEHMAYSCAYWRQDPATDDDGGYGITEAQRDKLELICRKLGLQPGMRLLDVGCGWGSLILYAAEHHGVHATGVTISAQQRDHVEKLVAERGLAEPVVRACEDEQRQSTVGRGDEERQRRGSVTVRLQDYRDVPVPAEGPYDAVASIEMSEHVGQEQYAGYAATLHRLVRPGGRVLVQAMSHPSAPGGGAFIERYVAPDMHMRPTWQTVELLAAPGLELRDVESLREHYDWTVAAWARRLEQRWDDVVDLIGLTGARIWRLYLAGGGLTFREGRMGVDQLLLVRPLPDGGSGMPATRAGWALP